MHPEFIFNAAAGVSRKPCPAGGVKGVHGFHQANGTDGDEIILIARLGVIFFGDVSHQAQIVPDEFFPGGRVTCPQGGKCFDFFFSSQWPWEASGFQMQRQHQKLRGEKLQQRQQHSSTSRSSSPIVYVAKWEGSTKRMLCFFLNVIFRGQLFWSNDHMKK